MKTADVPYAADAEVALTFDELQVRLLHDLLPFQAQLNPSRSGVRTIGLAYAVRKGGRPVPRHDSDKIQLRMGSRKEPHPRTPSRGRTAPCRLRSCLVPSVIATSHTPVPAEIYRSEPTRRRECLYYLALGHYKMGNFDEAKSFNCECPSSVPSALARQ